MKMGKGSGSDVGTGGMATKLSAAKIANASGADMIIANGDDFHVIHRLLDGRNIRSSLHGQILSAILLQHINQIKILIQMSDK